MTGGCWWILRVSGWVEREWMWVRVGMPWMGGFQLTHVKAAIHPFETSEQGP